MRFTHKHLTLYRIEGIQIYCHIPVFNLSRLHNEYFDAQKCARSSWLLVVTEPFNIAGNERSLA